jgi:hypothetical protein
MVVVHRTNMPNTTHKLTNECPIILREDLQENNPNCLVLELNVYD